MRRTKRLAGACTERRAWLCALTRKKLVATVSRREGVYNRTGEPSATFFEKGAAADKAKPYFMEIKCGEPKGLPRRGGPEGDRTLDLCIANAALSQLSYRPVFITQNSISQMGRIVKKKMRMRKGFFKICALKYKKAASLKVRQPFIHYLRTSHSPKAGLLI